VLPLEWQAKCINFVRKMDRFTPLKFNIFLILLDESIGDDENEEWRYKVLLEMIACIPYTCMAGIIKNNRYDCLKWLYEFVLLFIRFQYLLSEYFMTE